jgi:hypothetical protein
MKTAAAVLFACLTALPLSAQDTGKMEGDAKRGSTPDASRKRARSTPKRPQLRT